MRNIFEKFTKILKPKTDMLLTENWISVETPPENDMKVKWLCEDKIEDVGFYYSKTKDFASWDLRSTKPITHWKPLER